MVNNLILDALFLPLFWLIAFCFTASIGFVLIPFKNQQGVLSSNIFSCFWYGLIAIIAFLQVSNLFFPITIYCWLFLSPISIYGGYKIYNSDMFANTTKVRLLPAALAVIILIFLIFSCLNTSFIYDSLVYHFYTLKWFNNYSVVPGLGNLFTYLSLNQSYFLFAAFLNSFWSGYKGACATNGLLTLVICFEIVITNAKYLTREKPFTLHSIFQLLFLPLCINAGVLTLSSPTPDVLINLLTFKILSDATLIIENDLICFQDIYLIAINCLLGIVVKLSFLGIATGMLLLIVIFTFKKGYLYKRKPVVQAICLILTLLIPWMIRGVISSGYIGFPLSFFGFPVEWKVPKPVVESFAAFVKGFARTHMHGPGAFAAVYNYDWLLDWVIRMVHTIGFILPVTAFAIFNIILKLSGDKLNKLHLIYIPIIVSILFWFFTAPDIRFAYFNFWALGIYPWAYLTSRLKDRVIVNLPKFIIACSLLIIIRNWNTDLKPLGYLPVIEKSVFTTKSGFKINTIKGTPPNDVWTINDCDIPCSVLPDSNLVLRGNNIKYGFKINVPKK